MNIWKKLRVKRFWNNFHYFAILLVLCLYCVRYKSCFVILAIFLCICIYKRIFIKEILTLTFIFFILSNLRLEPRSVLQEGYFSGEIVVDSIDNRKDYFIVDMKYKKEKIRTTTRDFSYLPGDILRLSGTLVSADSNSYEGDFNYKAYLENKDIYFVLTKPIFTFLKSSFCIERLRYQLSLSLSTTLAETSYNFVKNLVLGMKGEAGIVENQLNELDLSYLIAISGMHIMLLYKLIFSIFFRLTHQYEKSETAAVVVVAIYVGFLGLPVSAIRALFFLGAQLINKRRLLNLSKLDVWSITLLIMLVIKPKWCFDLGFTLSFLVTFSYIILGDLYQGKSKLRAGISMSLIASTVCLPILINYKYSYNLIAILVGPFFIFLYSYIVLPLSFLTFLFKTNIFELFFSKVVDIQRILSAKQISLSLPYFTFSRMLVYYLLLGLIILAIYKRKQQIKWIGVMLAYFVLLNSLLFINPSGEVSIIDVGQGDSIYIRLPNNRGTVLIDSYNNNADYLKSKGVRKIDYIFITHSDEDHIQSLEEVCRDFPVNHLVGNYYDRDFLSMSQGFTQDVTTAKMGDVFTIGGYDFEILLPKVNAKEKNDNSLVIKVRLEGYTYLFTGDISIEQEKQLMFLYPNLKIDVLKVAHHGSSTSSSEDFINWINPTYSIISVGRNNRFSLPNNEVVERLKKYSIVYQTQYNGNIKFEFSKKKTKLLAYKN